MNLTMTELGKHPPLCFAIDGCQADGKRIIAIKRGEVGFFETRFSTEDASDEELVQCVNSLNEALGVTRQIKAAMVWGSLYGFDTPGADPANYDGEGGPAFRANRGCH